MKEQEKTIIAITGSKGRIGTVLNQGLKGFDITPIDLPDSDIRDYDKLKTLLKGCDMVVHLAWDTETDNFHTGKINPDNLSMVLNVYRAARENNVKRVIMASSVHADQFLTWDRDELMTPDQTPIPDSLYGVSKVYMETLGRYFATQGLEVICIRFGGFNFEDEPQTDNVRERGVHLRHTDCIELVKKCIEAKSIPDNFLIIYGVSDNQGRVVDYSNPLGWKPKEGIKN